MSNLNLKQNLSLTLASDTPYYYKVTIESQVHGANTRCCGNEKDLKSVLELYPDSTWEKVYLPATPKTLNVDAVDLGREYTLPQSDTFEFVL